MKIIEHSIEIERKDGEGIRISEAKKIFLFLRKNIEEFKNAKLKLIQEHKEGGSIYPTRLSIEKILPYKQGQKTLKKEIAKLLKKDFKDYFVMGVGSSIKC
jgi:hypothetical protein